MTNFEMLLVLLSVAGVVYVACEASSLAAPRTLHQKQKLVGAAGCLLASLRLCGLLSSALSVGGWVWKAWEWLRP